VATRSEIGLRPAAYQVDLGQAIKKRRRRYEEECRKALAEGHEIPVYVPLARTAALDSSFHRRRVAASGR
jgi:hypothetical protein